MHDGRHQFISERGNIFWTLHRTDDPKLDNFLLRVLYHILWFSLTCFQGRYVTVQATDSTNSLALEVSEILVTAGGEGCHVSYVVFVYHHWLDYASIRVLMRPWLPVTVWSPQLQCLSMTSPWWELDAPKQAPANKDFSQNKHFEGSCELLSLIANCVQIHCNQCLHLMQSVRILCANIDTQTQSCFLS